MYLSECRVFVCQFLQERDRERERESEHAVNRSNPILQTPSLWANSIIVAQRRLLHPSFLPSFLFLLRIFFANFLLRSKRSDCIK